VTKSALENKRDGSGV